MKIVLHTDSPFPVTLDNDSFKWEDSGCLLIGIDGKTCMVRIEELMSAVIAFDSFHSRLEHKDYPPKTDVRGDK